MYYGKMMTVCMRYSGNYEEARDILNEGYIKVFNNLASYLPHHSLESWIRRIMINTAIDHFRKNKKFQHTADIETAYHLSEENNFSILGQISAEEIIIMVQQLSPAYRTVFNLYVLEGLGHKEIAEMLGITVGSSKSNLSKAKANLQGMIREKMPELYAQYSK